LKQSHKEDGRPATLWYWKDWFADVEVMTCSLAAQGLWINMLGIMSMSEIMGALIMAGKQMDNKNLAAFVRASEEETDRLLEELESHNVFSRLEDGTIINRRMYGEGELSRIRAEAGKKGASSRWQIDSKNVEIGDGKGITRLADANANAVIGGSGGRPKFEPRHLDLARFLEAKIRENVPYHKFTGTNYLESWAREFRLMEDRDKIPFQDIKFVLERSLEDEFWRINILSAGTFREKFGRLAAKLSGDNKRGPDPPHIGANAKQDKSPAWWAEHNRLVSEGLAGHDVDIGMAKFEKAQGLEGQALTDAIKGIEKT